MSFILGTQGNIRFALIRVRTKKTKVFGKQMQRFVTTIYRVIIINRGTFSLKKSMRSIKNINGLVHAWYCCRDIGQQ